MAVTIRIEDFADLVRDLPKDMEFAVIAGLRSAARRLEMQVAVEIMQTTPFPPEDTGRMKASINTEPVKDGAVVYVSAPHAVFMEEGTRPHFPPLAPLTEWALRKGLADTEEEAEEVALSVARKIAARGIAPRKFFARAITAMNAGPFREEIEDALREHLP